MKTKMKRITNRKGRMGAVALEYILIAALVAIALMAAFVYFRNTLQTGVEKMSDVAGEGIGSSVKTARDSLGKDDSGYKE